MKKVVFVMAVLFLFSNCNDVKLPKTGESPEIALVKYGSLAEACPGTTMEELANYFMKSPTWTSEVIEGTIFVKVSGAFIGTGSEAASFLKFVVNEKNNTFDIHSLGE